MWVTDLRMLAGVYRRRMQLDGSRIVSYLAVGGNAGGAPGRWRWNETAYPGEVPVVLL